MSFLMQYFSSNMLKKTQQTRRFNSVTLFFFLVHFWICLSLKLIPILHNIQLFIPQQVMPIEMPADDWIPKLSTSLE